MTNEQVIIEWSRGNKAKAGNLSTDGNFLYSYRLVIGKDAGGTIYNHTSPGGSYYSQTTSTHVNLAKGLVPRAEVVNFK